MDNGDTIDPKDRRHTISSRPKPKDPPPMSRKTSDFSREKFSPPEVMLDSLYSTVDKTKRYPAPNVPAPPPPYEGKAMKDAPKKAEENSITERTVSPPGYEPVASATSPSSSSVTTTSSSSSARKPSTGGARPPPSRPSRPPAGWHDGYSYSATLSLWTLHTKENPLYSSYHFWS